MPAFVGSNPTGPVEYETLAQSVEHLTFNQVVAGSIPTCLTANCFVRDLTEQFFSLEVLYARSAAGMQQTIQSGLHSADMAKLADAPDLGSGGRPCRFKSCHPHS